MEFEIEAFNMGLHPYRFLIEEGMVPESRCFSLAPRRYDTVLAAGRKPSVGPFDSI